MYINQLNSDTINTSAIDIHDYIFNELKFIYEEKKIIVKISAENTELKKIMIEFNNVIGFDMVSCDFWGKSPHILNWMVRNPCDQVLVNKLTAEKNDNNYLFSRLSENKVFFESVITFASGDKLTIACEYITL